MLKKKKKRVIAAPRQGWNQTSWRSVLMADTTCGTKGPVFLQDPCVAFRACVTTWPSACRRCGAALPSPLPAESLFGVNRAPVHLGLCVRGPGWKQTEEQKKHTSWRVARLQNDTKDGCSFALFGFFSLILFSFIESLKARSTQKFEILTLG